MSKFEEREIDILHEVTLVLLPALVHDVCKSSLDELTEEFLRNRAKPPQENPLLFTILHFIDEAVSAEARSVAVEVLYAVCACFQYVIGRRCYCE